MSYIGDSPLTQNISIHTYVCFFCVCVCVLCGLCKVLCGDAEDVLSGTVAPVQGGQGEAEVRHRRIQAHTRYSGRLPPWHREFMHLLLSNTVLGVLLYGSSSSRSWFCVDCFLCLLGVLLYLVCSVLAAAAAAAGSASISGFLFGAYGRQAVTRKRRDTLLILC